MSQTTMHPIEQGYFPILRKQAADKEDLLSLQLLDIAEQLPEHERSVIVALVAFKVKHEVLSVLVCSTMTAAASKAMQLTYDLGIVSKKESPNVPR